MHHAIACGNKTNSTCIGSNTQSGLPALCSFLPCVEGACLRSALSSKLPSFLSTFTCLKRTFCTEESRCRVRGLLVRGWTWRVPGLALACFCLGRLDFHFSATAWSLRLALASVSRLRFGMGLSGSACDKHEPSWAPLAQLLVGSMCCLRSTTFGQGSPGAAFSHGRTLTVTDVNVSSRE